LAPSLKMRFVSSFSKWFLLVGRFEVSRLSSQLAYGYQIIDFHVADLGKSRNVGLQERLFVALTLCADRFLSFDGSFSVFCGTPRVKPL
jgi:hypothetical protein